MHSEWYQCCSVLCVWQCYSAFCIFVAQFTYKKGGPGGWTGKKSHKSSILARQSGDAKQKRKKAGPWPETFAPNARQFVSRRWQERHHASTRWKTGGRYQCAGEPCHDAQKNLPNPVMGPNHQTLNLQMKITRNIATTSVAPIISWR